MIRQGLLDIQKVEPSILVDLKYSTTDNFLGKDIYGDLNRAYLQPAAAKKLAKASSYLKKVKPTYRLLVYDAARSKAAQVNLWNSLKLPEGIRQKYVAPPRLGSIHSYGCAVDLTIAALDGKSGQYKPLDMGTKFDYFGDLAYPEKEEALLKAGKLTKKQVENRRLLRSVMAQAGFSSIKTEWWHFNALSRSQAKATYKIVE
ncbi:M15 family metallopeptidase [Tellurirhabdus bombi]|uniref:M15 family metallopeptidase n=1 Tax=Tellurirhabdus bombi TaxID=2907205 RepID=UPI001F433990|nr:M15 family metallopeptidase [Tellurirhabdus bombi]